LHRGALVAVLLLHAGLAAAKPVDAVKVANQAVAHCKAGDLDDAADELHTLLESLEAQYGPGHTAPLIVRLNLAEIEKRLGHDRKAAEIGKLPAEDPNAPKIDSKLKRALRGLAVCATAKPSQIAKPMPSRPDTVVVTSAAQEQLNLARKLATQGQYRRALDTAKLARSSAGDSPPAPFRMQLHETLAIVRLQLGDRAGAVRDAGKADAIARKSGSADVRINVVRLVAQAGDLERAGALLREVKPSATSPEDKADYDEAAGDLALRLGSPRSALGHLQRALAGHKQVHGANHAYTAAVHHLRGDAYRQSGDFPAAMRAYDEALRIRRASLGPKSPETARTRNAIGLLQADLRDWRAADESFGAALVSLDASLGAEHPETITIRSNRALARFGASGKASAVDEYAQTVNDLARALGDDHPSVAAATRNLARFEAERGNGKRAEELLEQVLQAQTRSLGPDHPDLGQTRLQRGRLLARRGKLREAAAEIDAAIAIQSKSLGPEHPAVARARISRARIAVALGDDATALREAEEASRAIAVYTRRTFGAISDRQRSLLTRDSQDVLGALLSVPNAPAKPLFVSMLPHRDSVLRSIAASRAAARGAKGGEFLGQLADLRARYVAAMHGQGPGTAARAKKLAKQIEGVERLAAAAGSRMFDLDPTEVLSLACSRIPDDAVLIKFTAYERTARGKADATVPAYAALVVRGRGCDVQRIDLGDASRIDGAAEAFGSAMREQRSDAPDARAALSSALLGKLGAGVLDTPRWLVIPDGALWGVPIGALPDPKKRDDYLIERIGIGYLTSTYELAEASATQSNPNDVRRALLIGAPDFGGTEGGGPVVLTKSGPCQVPPFEDLPATAEELEDIRKLIGSDRVVSGADVTKQRLAKELGSKPWLVHFATHAYFAGLGGCEAEGGGREGPASQLDAIDANPLVLSGIVLAGANNPTQIDGGAQGGILTAYEVAGMDLGGAGLVVLSACDTGTGLHLRGQEVQGLRWGFRAAGARALVTSLWRSNDAATRAMMHAFYETLISPDLADDPLRGAEALRRAQLHQVERDKRLGMKRPLIWANFIFSGVL
jgi:CHAT domain-containing protein/tetratricopeptide (TPR) repeat protein